MILDTERQRLVLLELLKSVQIPGAALDELFALKQSIKEAALGEEPVESTAHLG